MTTVLWFALFRRRPGGWQLLAKAATDSIKALLKGTTPRHLLELAALNLPLAAAPVAVGETVMLMTPPCYPH